MKVDSFFLPEGDGFVSTTATRGPWSEHHQHGGPPAALIGRAIERLAGGEDKVVTRITFEILKPIPIAPVSVEAQVIRPGRKIDLCDAALLVDGDPVMLARAWRFRLADVDLPEQPALEPPGHGPADAEEKPFFPVGYEFGYHAAMEWLFVTGSFLEPGDAIVWMRMRIPLLPDEEPTGLQRVLCTADSASGVSCRVDPRRIGFPNTDLTVGLMRPPDDVWVCLDATTRLEPHGIGVTESTILDERGPLGRSLQSLLVSEVPR